MSCHPLVCVCVLRTAPSLSTAPPYSMLLSKAPHEKCFFFSFPFSHPLNPSVYTYTISSVVDISVPMSPFPLLLQTFFLKPILLLSYLTTFEGFPFYFFFLFPCYFYTLCRLPKCLLPLPPPLIQILALVVNSSPPPNPPRV